MASATTNMLRDLGFVLGPVVGAVALGDAGSAFATHLAGADLRPVRRRRHGRSPGPEGPSP
ncbi:hypothetical protein [Streptomyces sp. NPDC052107]|uniref:hypothetical protein n=1 Tax=Streptomyces sp. NPDC052107 TaxID=3155632 RepID=UPI00341D1A3B